MPRVFHLIKSLGRGGAEMLLVENLRLADRGRFDYGYGYFLPWKSAMVPSLREQEAEVTCFDRRNVATILMAARQVAHHLEEWGADLVHCHLPIAGVVGRLAGRMCGVPVVYTEHNRMERYHPLTRRLNLLTWRWQERAIAVSAEVASSIHDHAGERVPVEVVLNGIDIDRFDRSRVEAREIREGLGIPTSVPVVGTVAVFRAQKRLEEWLSAARDLLDEHPDTHFVLVGDGPLREDLVLRARDLGIQDRTHFPGLREDVRPYLAAMDVFMVSSAFEGLPLALLESMAMECGVVATTVGGIPEVIRHGENGFLAPPGRPRELTRLASRILSSPGLGDRMGEAARETVGERFGLKRMTRHLESIYTGVLENGRGTD